MAKHNCLLWTSLGFNCPGGVQEQAESRRRSGGDAEAPDRMPRIVPVHDTPRSNPPQINRYIYIRIMRSIRRFLNIKKSQAENAREMAPPREVEVIHARDIPIPEVLRLPIPEIAITGATAAAIMLAERAFGGRGEQWVANQVARQGRGRTTTVQNPDIKRTKPVGKGGITRTGGPSAGSRMPASPFHFNAADELRRRLRKETGGGGNFFPGILG